MSIAVAAVIGAIMAVRHRGHNPPISVGEGEGEIRSPKSEGKWRQKGQEAEGGM
jgi:hypothetical protein